MLAHYPNGDISRSREFSERFQLSRNVSTNSYILTIRELQLRDTNTYICEIWGTVFGKGTQLNVTSANVPVLFQSPNLERVTEGHTARLQCTMRNAAMKNTDVQWYQEQPGKNMEWVLTHDVRNITQWSPGFTERFQPSRDSSNETFILTITNVQPSDTAVYYCKVWSDISGNGSQLTVTGANDPILLQSPSVKCVTKGHTAQLQCTMKNATVKDTEVHWYLEQPGNNTKLVLTHDTRNITQRSSGFTERFQSSRDTNSNSFILTITNMQPSDSGNYFCEMWGDISGNGIQLTVTGSNPAVLLQSQSLESVTKGQTARLQCTMRNAAVTQTEVSWVREQAGNSMDWALIHDVMNMTHRILGFPERFQSSRDSSSNSFILTITNVQPNDTGVYHCEVCGNISGTGIQLCVTAQSGAADDPDTTAGYENVRTPQTLQPMDRSIYSNLKETDKK
ncbi:hypothetical protein chiPu_0018686 [Chiloscyllium punctatum]|uniref:Ig-like domain-containing protein n=1 Tax=Chiloscyllium punctatum TaxID=137246 RepID=A0A401RPB3_CHIPU|nr:hypothetical protein [Chiloscyllium punctatum]